MKTIKLTQGKVALVDDADYEAVSQFKWYAVKRRGAFHAARKIRKPDGSRIVQYLHQFLLPNADRVDHRSGDGLNNLQENIRPATRRQNGQGFRRNKIGFTSKFRGVHWHKRRLKWTAQIKVDGKIISLGYFTDEVDAAHAYDAAARKYFVDGFLQLNFP